MTSIFFSGLDNRLHRRMIAHTYHYGSKDSPALSLFAAHFSTQGVVRPWHGSTGVVRSFCCAGACAHSGGGSHDR